jgi:serine/threonine-protein kinase HipA
MRCGPYTPVLSYSYIGATDADTVATLKSQSDKRIVRTGGKWSSLFQNLLLKSHNRERLARERGCREDDEFELLGAAGDDRWVRLRSSLSRHKTRLS